MIGAVTAGPVPSVIRGGSKALGTERPARYHAEVTAQAEQRRRTGSQETERRSAGGTARSFFRRRWRAIAWGIAVAVLLETFFFNLPFWQTLRGTARTIPVAQMTLTGLKRAPGGLEVVDAQDAGAAATLPSSEGISYLRLDVSPDAAPQTLRYTFFECYPEQTGFYTGTAWGSSYTRSPRSLYVGVHSSAWRVGLAFHEPAGTVIPLEALTVNPRIPFHISAMRDALLLAVVALVALFGAGSPLWTMRLDTRSAFQTALLWLSTIAVMAFYVWMWKESNSAVVWRGQRPGMGETESFDQYADLADALLHGHLWLNLPVAHGLLTMPNPYDWKARETLSAAGQTTYFDHAFYHGHYYCYFGVIPAVLFFLPYRAITGKALASAYPILLCALVGAVFATLFVVRLAKTYFRDPSIGAVLFASWMLGLGSGILYQVFTASFYSVPESASYAATLGALWLWLSSLRTRDGGKRISSWRVFLGSLLMACNLGCRPQYLAAALLAVPIFWDSVFRDRSLFSRRGLAATICAILPFALVFVPLLAYNKARFGGILNFGNEYQLTGYDCQNTVFSLTTIPAMAYDYLFQPMNLTSLFPFVGTASTPTTVFVPAEPSEGGFFAFVAPFALVLFLAPTVFSRRHARRLERRMIDGRPARRTTIGIVWTCVGAATAMLCADAHLAGFSGRYIGDFGLLLVIAAIIALFALLPADERHSGASANIAIAAGESSDWLVLDDVRRCLAFALCFLLVFALLAEFFATFDIGRYGDLFRYAPWHYFPVRAWFLAVD